jgi:hypothetical protein
VTTRETQGQPLGTSQKPADRGQHGEAAGAVEEVTSAVIGRPIAALSCRVALSNRAADRPGKPD